MLFYLQMFLTYFKMNETIKNFQMKQNLIEIWNFPSSLVLQMLHKKVLYLGLKLYLNRVYRQCRLTSYLGHIVEPCVSLLAEACCRIDPCLRVCLLRSVCFLIVKWVSFFDLFKKVFLLLIYSLAGKARSMKIIFSSSHMSSASWSCFGFGCD